jgi:hypothetical protein
MPLPRLVFLLLARHIVAQTVTVAPTVPSEAPEFVDDDTFTSAILNSTNFYRAEHNASDVRWNETLEDFASEYLDSTCEFEHSGGPYGENLAIGCSNATSCVEAWGNERDIFDFSDPKFSMEAGHFSQLVWKNTTDVGCARRLCDESGWYLACEYWPRGNVEGAYEEEINNQANGATLNTPTGYLIVTIVSLAWVCSLLRLESS